MMNILSVARFSQNLDEIKRLIGDLVSIESPSTEKAAVDRLGDRIQADLKSLGAEVTVFANENAGNHIRARWGTGSKGILLLSHMDTVFDIGTLAKNPYRENGGRLYGPGVQDMKSSIAMLLTCLRVFQQEGCWPDRPVTALFTTDEETGSLTSRELIEREASQAGVVFTLEPALANGAIKTARKGTGDIYLDVKGVASHAGVDHEKGRNAIEELAHHILAAQRLTDYTRGTTVNVGVISGGTRSNVVPEDAKAEIDFRVTRMDEYQRLKSWADGIAPVLHGTMVSARVDLNRPPMPRDDTMIETFGKARLIAKEIGLDLREGSTGGGSDANFVAPLGIPVLDGLGPVGDGAHSEREYVEVESLAERTALLAALLLNW
jgi:glutamate carboxypeptidase